MAVENNAMQGIGRSDSHGIYNLVENIMVAWQPLIDTIFGLQLYTSPDQWLHVQCLSTIFFYVVVSLHFSPGILFLNKCFILVSAPNLNLECNIDLLFLLDSSSTSSLETFMQHKSFLKRFIQAAMSDDSPVNVGVAQYSKEVQMVVKINEYENIGELLRYVDNMRFMGGGIYTGKALRYVTQHGFKSTPTFSDVRDDLPRVVVLLTGSRSQDSVKEPAQYARDHEVFLIGVASDTNKEEMTEIVGNPQNVIEYSSPQHLFNQLPQLQKRICSVDIQGQMKYSSSNDGGTAGGRVQGAIKGREILFMWYWSWACTL